MLNIKNRRLLKWTAIVLSLPLGVMGIEWASGLIHRPPTPVFQYNPLTHKANGLPIKDVALAAPDDPDDMASGDAPQGGLAGNPLADAVIGSLNPPSSPQFTVPDAKDRLAILHKMVCAYCKAEKLNIGRTGIVIGTVGSRIKRVEAIPDTERLRAWFEGLTPRQRVTIDWRFTERKAYIAFINGIGRQTSSDGLVSLGRPAAYSSVCLFEHWGDVFISPRDGEPFLIGLAKGVRFPSDRYAHDVNIIARESTGVASIDYRYLEERREVMSLGITGQIDRFYEATR